MNTGLTISFYSYLIWKSNLFLTLSDKNWTLMPSVVEICLFYCSPFRNIEKKKCESIGLFLSFTSLLCQCWAHLLLMRVLFATEFLYDRKRQKQNLLEGVKDWQIGSIWVKHSWRSCNIFGWWVLRPSKTNTWRKQINGWT